MSTIPDSKRVPRKGQTRNLSNARHESRRRATSQLQQQPLKQAREETVLFAVTGMSPAVLTETVWALAHETPPTIPDRVVVVTTVPGKLRIDEELFTPMQDYDGLTVWQALRRQILGEAFLSDSRLNIDPIRVIARRDPNQGRSYLLEDIRTPADNEVAADFILEELRKLTENPDTRIVASLAGGRKTMSALLYAAMSLLGRAHDRLTHVLVNEPFDHPALSPRFYFPAPDDRAETLHQLPSTGAAYSSVTAQLWLADVPFVRLRYLFTKQLGRYPGNFNGLVRAYSTRIQEISGQPEIVLDPKNLTLQIGDVTVTLNAREFAVYQFLAERCRDGKPPFPKHQNAPEEFRPWLVNWTKQYDPITSQYESLSKWTNPEADELRKHISGIRKKIIAAGLGHLERYLLPQRGAFGIQVRLRKS